jgi:2-C-methyl-D-erythritol 4-phosphate cytidylyltransferase
MTTFAAIIPAAGTGSRSGQSIPKQYVELAGAPVLAHTIGIFAGMPGCGEVIVAVDEEWRATAERCALGATNVRFVMGGAERQHSIANALASVATNPDLILVHDAARPCASRELVERVIEAAMRHGAAIPALPIAETVKRIDAGGVIVETIPRGNLRAAQTPQGFRRDLLLRAYAHAEAEDIVGTDDASLVETLGVPVHVVDGEPGNIKITIADDFARAGARIRKSKANIQKAEEEG